MVLAVRGSVELLWLAPPLAAILLLRPVGAGRLPASAARVGSDLASAHNVPSPSLRDERSETFTSLARAVVEHFGATHCTILTVSGDRRALVQRGVATTRRADDGPHNPGEGGRIPLEQAPLLASTMREARWSSTSLRTVPAIARLLGVSPFEAANVCIGPLTQSDEASGVLCAIVPFDTDPSSHWTIAALRRELECWQAELQRALQTPVQSQLVLPVGRLLQALPAPLVLLNADGRVLAVNQAAARFLGDGAERLVGQRLCSGDRPCSCAIHRAMYEQEQIEAEATSVFGARLALNGPAQMTVLPLPHSAGDTTLAVIILSQSARLPVEDPASASPVEVAAMLVHDLRSPLAALQMASQLALDEELSESERGRLLMRISRQVERLDQMTGDLLDAYRDGLEPARLRSEPVDVQQLCLEVAEQLGTGSERSLVLDIDRGSFAFADAAKVRCILRNLLGNAIKHTEHGDPIRISVCRLGDQLRISVADGGPGIALDQQPLIFDRLVRAEPGRGSTAGYGIGLFAARRLVELHGGRIWVESKPGNGACFHFTLTCYEPDEPTTARQLSAPGSYLTRATQAASA
ncbi:MAG TPA: ATP-binding protein [Dehalococcoidia bacterium]